MNLAYEAKRMSLENAKTESCSYCPQCALQHFFFFKEHISNMTWQKLKGRIPKNLFFFFAAYILSAIEVILLVSVTQQANRAQD